MLLHKSNIITRAFMSGSVPRQPIFTSLVRAERSSAAPLFICSRVSERSPARSTRREGLTHQSRMYSWRRHEHSPSKTTSWHYASNSSIFRDVTSRTTLSRERQGRCYSTTSTPESPEKTEVDLRALAELEIELYRQEGYKMPSNISERHWEDLLTKKTVYARKKYLTFLFKNEMKALNELKRKERRREIREEERRKVSERLSQEERHIEYGLWKNSIFLKILESTMNHHYHCKVIQAMLFGQPIVIDLDFNDHMNERERQNCAYQIQMMISENRKHIDPYSIEVCNAPPTIDLMTRLERYIPIMHKPDYPVTFNPKSYLDKFPKERLVYLTPHTQHEMREYDHDAVYIIGGIVDKSSAEPLTFAKAKREGIRMQKLPLERYLSWGIGNKCLPLNQILLILLDMKVSGDWSYAFRHVPRRKLQSQWEDQQTQEEKLLKKIRNKRNSRGY